MRPDWDSYFMKIAYAVSERSTCDRAFVGCVLVLEKRILTTGFNGSPAGQSHCTFGGDAMQCGLNDGIRFGMDRAYAMSIHHEMTDFIAM
jgi:deoxycytidylate deaminase